MTANVKASASYTLPDHLQTLSLTGTGNLNGTGNGLANQIHGNAGLNILDGGAGDDQLEGVAGNDTLSGGAGDDQLEGGAGNDTLSGGSGDDALFGDQGNDRLLGGAGNDTLYIRGGDAVAGESYIGGTGADTLYIIAYEGSSRTVDISHVSLSEIERLSGPAYSVSMTASQIVEFNSIYATIIIVVDGGVIDLRHAGVVDTIFQLSDQGNTLLLSQAGIVDGGGGDDVISAAGADGLSYFYGYGGDDTLTGGATSDTLDGGFGADQMTGGAGGDRYVVNSADNRVIDFPGGGIDEVISLMNFALGANVEILRLEGTQATEAMGNALDDRIIGNRAANTLEGGAGNDFLIGDTGADLFVCYSANSGIDTIDDFASWQGDELVFKGASAWCLQLSRCRGFHGRW